jgi:SpoVK/Ycf46/Vps4 family AAA+-type ATPase
MVCCTVAVQAAAGGGEPSDAIRAVNALLTQLDQLRHFPNVMVLTTSNITEAIDVAFVDRADIKVGPLMRGFVGLWGWR